MRFNSFEVSRVGQWNVTVSDGSVQSYIERVDWRWPDGPDASDPESPASIFWGVYGIDEEGIAEHIADRTSQQTAMELAEAIADGRQIDNLQKEG